MANVASVNVFTASVEWDDAWAARDKTSGCKWTISPSQNATLIGADTTTVQVSSTADPQVERTLTFVAYDGAMSSDPVSIKFTPDGISLPAWPPEDNSDMTITIECEIPEGETVYKELDLFLATDCSGSMTSWMDAYKAALGKVLSDVRTLGAPDVKTGNTGYGGGSNVGLTFFSDLNANDSYAQSSLSSMYTTTGNDTTLACFRDLAALSTWRSTSLNMLVINSSDWQGVGDISSDNYNTIATALINKGIQVYAIGPDNGKHGPQMAATTGGATIPITNGVSGDSMVGYIQAAIAQASSNLTVKLTPDGNMPANFIKEINPVQITGVSRGDPSFTFDVTFNGEWIPSGTAVSYSFELELIADDFAIIETTTIAGTIRR